MKKCLITSGSQTHQAVIRCREMNIPLAIKLGARRYKISVDHTANAVTLQINEAGTTTKVPMSPSDAYLLAARIKEEADRARNLGRIAHGRDEEGQ
jgi:hypothetical protein